MKIELITQENVKLTINQYDALRKQLQAKNKLSKFLGVCRSKPFCCKWKAAESNEISIKSAGWQTFITKIQLYCSSTENDTLKHFSFCSIIQEKTFYKKKCFIAFCKRVEKEAQL